jgi:hypothetical protein
MMKTVSLETNKLLFMNSTSIFRTGFIAADFTGWPTADVNAPNGGILDTQMGLVGDS